MIYSNRLFVIYPQIIYGAQNAFVSPANFRYQIFFHMSSDDDETEYLLRSQHVEKMDESWVFVKNRKILVSSTKPEIGLSLLTNAVRVCRTKLR